jgi:hypothetical protein
VRGRLVLLSSLLLAPALAWSQQLEVTVQGGYFRAATEQFEREVVRSTSTGYAVDHYDARHGPGTALGVTLSAWPLPHVGLDLAGAVRLCGRSGSAPFVVDPFLPVPAGDRAVLSTLALRLVGRTRVGGTIVRFGAGPAVVHIGGSAYDGGTAEVSLAKRTLGGATLQGDVTRTVGSLRLRISVEDALYRVTMASLPPGSDTTRTPLQHDLALTAGVVVALR